MTEHNAERCKRCDHENPAWSASSPLWNAVMRGGTINGEPLFDDMVCPACFIVLAGEAASGWCLTADTINIPVETVTPSGRIWDSQQGLWVDPSAVGIQS